MFLRRWAAIGFLACLAWSASAAADETVELFNGKDLTGWTKHGGNAVYEVEDGEIVGRSAPNTSNTFLCTDKEYVDFTLECDFKISDPEFNSGFQLRSHVRPEGDHERVYGYQIEIDPKPRAWTGGLYFEAGNDARKAGWLNDLTTNEPARQAFHLGEWNHMKIVANGRHIQSWINGVPAADFTETDDKAFSPSGFLGLQVHAVGKSERPMEVRWKNLKLTQLNESSNSAGQ